MFSPNRHFLRSCFLALVVASTSICSLVGISFLILPALFSDHGDDSWQHFQSGGMFITSSPSGATEVQTIVYSSPCTGHGDIYAMAMRGEAPQRVTTSDYFETSPVVSHAKDRVYFSREIGGFRNIWAANLGGGNELQLTFGRHQDECMQISSDDRYLLFQRATGSFLGHGRNVEAKLIDLESSNRGLIDAGCAAVISDATGVAVYTHDQSSMLTVELDSGQIVGEPMMIPGIPLHISKDGRYLVSSRVKADGTYADREIWMFDYRTGKGKYVADGYAAVVFGAPAARILVTRSGTSWGSYDVNDLREIEAMRGVGVNTVPRVTQDGQSVLITSFARSGESDFRILSLGVTDASFSEVLSSHCPGR